MCTTAILPVLLSVERRLIEEKIVSSFLRRSSRRVSFFLSVEECGVKTPRNGS